MVVRVLFVPVPTISGAPRAAHTRAHASMTARFSSASSAVASPVVPSATMPADAGGEVLVAEALDRVDVDRARRVERRDQRDPDTAEVEVARHAESVPVGGVLEVALGLLAATCCSSSLTLLVGVVTGVLSGMFGVGGAVRLDARDPRARRDAARGGRLDAAVDHAVVDLGSLRYHRERLIRAASCSWTSAFGVPASVGRLAALAAASPATATR